MNETRKPIGYSFKREVGKVNMEVWELIECYKRNHPNGHFFDHDTLKFFGERESEMRVLKRKENIKGHECYVLSSLQRKYPTGPRRVWHYFDVETFDDIL